MEPTPFTSCPLKEMLSDEVSDGPSGSTSVQSSRYQRDSIENLQISYSCSWIRETLPEMRVYFHASSHHEALWEEMERPCSIGSQSTLESGPFQSDCAGTVSLCCSISGMKNLP